MSTRTTKDHPRGCGEYLYLGNPHRRYRGSPPRVRGIPPAPPLQPCIGRITPAGAGNTGVFWQRHDHLRDHPRGCGEYGRRFEHRDRR